LRFAIGMWGLAALKRRSRVYVPAPSDLPKVATSRQECELRLCDEEMGPITWGVLHPVVLLPKSAVSWPRERLHAVLLHELAHIRRRDSFAHLLSHIACALYWPNPFVWIGANRLCHEAEIAADDAAIVSGVKPSTYAEQLLQLAAEFRGRHTALSNTALFMAAPSALEARVKSALSPTQLRTGVTSMDVVKIAGFGLCAATAIAFAFPSLAQDATPSAPPEMAAPAAPAQPDAAPAPPAMAAPEMPPQPAPPPAPPAPPAEVNAPADAVDATAPVDAATADEPTDSSVHIVVDGRNLDTLSSADRKRIRIEVEKARIEAREAIAKARPEIEKARREAHEAMQKAKPEIDRAVAQVRLNEQTIRDVQPQIDAAAAEIAKAQPEIEKALAAAQPEIDRALAQVHADLADGHLDVRIQERVDAALKRAEIKIKAAQVRIKNTQREEQSKTAPDSN
jgi:hypothetical protein